MSPIVFDLFGVLMHKQPARYQARLAALAGVDQAAFSAAYWQARPDYDRGCSAKTYWTAVGQRLDVVFDSEQVRQLAAIDNRGWSFVDFDMRALMESLCAAGTPLYLLSNIPYPLLGRLDAHYRWLVELFEARFMSCEMGVAKPSPAAFEPVLAAIGRRYRRQLIRFVDDTADNVATADALGINAHHFVDLDSLRSWLGDAPAAGHNNARD